MFWFVGVFGFFAIAITKLPSYVLPVMPAAAILVALFWSDQMTQPLLRDRRGINQWRRNRWGMKLSGLFNSLFFLALAGAILCSPHWVRSGY